MIARIDLLTSYIGRTHRTIVAERHHDKQRLIQITDIFHAVFHDRGRISVKHRDIGLFANLNAADLVIKIQCIGRAQRRQIVGVRGAEGKAAQLRDFMSLVHGHKLREARTGAKICCQSNADRAFGIECLFKTETAAAQE